MFRYVAAAVLVAAGCSSAQPSSPEPDGGRPDDAASEPDRIRPVVAAWDAPTSLVPGSRVAPRFGAPTLWRSARLQLDGDEGVTSVELELDERAATPPTFSIPARALPASGAPGTSVRLGLALDGVEATAPSTPFAVARLAPSLREPTIEGLVVAGGRWSLRASDIPLEGEGGVSLEVDAVVERASSEDGSLPFRATLPALGVSGARDEVVVSTRGLELGRWQGSATLVWETAAGERGRGEPVPLDIEVVAPAPALPESLTLRPGWAFPVLDGLDPFGETVWSVAAEVDLGEGDLVGVDTVCEPVSGRLLCALRPASSGSGDGFEGLGPVEGSAHLELALLAGAERSETQRVPVTLLPAVQIVAVQTTDAFQRALDRFGLATAAVEVERRALERMALHLDPERVIFVRATDELPALAVAVTWLELSGADPNGLGLLGYDNTPGKDVGNRRMGDRIGGVNAITQANGDPGYGGVFIESFLFWSSRPPAPLVRPPASPSPDPAFDEVFGTFLDRPLAPGEWSDPGAGRHPAAQRAVTALAHLIAETAAHEVGHALGLAHPEVPDGAFHRTGDTPGCLMDAGDARPLVERMGLDGGAPAGLCDAEVDYVRAILPGRAR